MKQFITNVVAGSKSLRSLTRKIAQLYFSATNSDIERQVRTITKGRVLDGPFKGLSYPILPGSTVHTSTVPKLLGIYEKELYPGLERLLSGHSYDRFIDIGAAEGYYVAGVAQRSAGAKIIAFEADLGLQASLATVCKENHVSERVEIRGWCSPSDLLAIGTSQRTLLLCDCEGGEIELITQETIAALGTCDMIVECHDMYVPDCCNILSALLSKTHKIEIVTSHERTLTDIPTSIRSQISGRPDEIEYAIGEHRHYEMSWIIAERIDQ